MSRRPPIIGLVLVTLSVSAVVVLVLNRRETPKERFIAEATAICEASKQDVEVAFAAQLGNAADARADCRVPLGVRSPPSSATGSTGSRRWTCRRGTQDELAELFADYRAVVDAVAADPARFATEQDPFSAVDRRFDDYGLEACGSAPPRD